MMGKIKRNNTGIMQPDQELVVAGYAGLAGTRMLVKEKRQELEQYFTKAYLNQILRCRTAAADKNLEYWKRFGATECEPSGQGGILKTLWDLSGAYETGIRFSLRQIPVKQATIEICERLELNPYRLYSRGCYLLVADQGGRTAAALEKEGIAAQVIGKVERGIARVVLGGGSVGFLERPRPDELSQAVDDCSH